VYIGVDDKRVNATVAGLEQGYVVCPSHQRFLLLFTFLKKNLKKKIIVFFATCMTVKYYAELLNYIDIPVLDLHGQQKQKKRTSTFFEFCNAERGILLCTDVAARGLDIPAVDWILQFDPPDAASEYIHRVGRTARGVGTTGQALLFLLPDELGFLKYLKHAKVPLNEYEFPLHKLAKVQSQLQRLVSQNYYLHTSAREAYRSYLQSYAQNALKHIFDVHKLDLVAVAKSFGFEVPPKVHLKISLKNKKKPDRAARPANGTEGKSHGISGENPYGGGQRRMSKKELRKKGRQWSR
jgi:ATP-dependent RNA helicase DDX18/HAS1